MERGNWAVLRTPQVSLNTFAYGVFRKKFLLLVKLLVCFVCLVYYIVGLLIFMAGKSYDVVSFDSHESDATVFLTSSSQPKIGRQNFRCSLFCWIYFL